MTQKYFFIFVMSYIGVPKMAEIIPIEPDLVIQNREMSEKCITQVKTSSYLSINKNNVFKKLL